MEFQEAQGRRELLVLRWIVIQGLYSQNQDCLEIEIQIWTLEFIGYFRWEVSKVSKIYELEWSRS